MPLFTYLRHDHPTVVGMENNAEASAHCFEEHGLHFVQYDVETRRNFDLKDGFVIIIKSGIQIKMSIRQKMISYAKNLIKLVNNCIVLKCAITV